MNEASDKLVAVAESTAASAQALLDATTSIQSTVDAVQGQVSQVIDILNQKIKDGDQSTAVQQATEILQGANNKLGMASVVLVNASGDLAATIPAPAPVVTPIDAPVPASDGN